MRKVSETRQYLKESKIFPPDVMCEISELILRYICGEILPSSCFKTFTLGTGIKVQEFRVKDSSGNWRAISCFIKKDELVLLYAFHKKSQKLLEKDKTIIINRIRRLRDE